MLATTRILATVIVGSIFLAPLWTALGGAVAAAFSPFCHQEPARSWTLFGTQLPVCIRCLGFYLGVLAACSLGLRFAKKQLAAAVALAAAGLGIEFLVGGVGAEIVRFTTALALAASLAPVLWSGTGIAAFPCYDEKTS